MRLVDSHCHLDHEDFSADLEAVLDRARTAGVDRLLVIGTGNGPPDLEAGIRLAEAHPEIYATAGVHPHDAAKAGDETFIHLERLLSHPKVVAAGEIGLDYHYNFSPPEVQRTAFVRQLEIARRMQKPVVIHTREAWDDTLSILRAEWTGGGVMHCFTAGVAEARATLDLGFHLGLGGVLTFPKAAELREAAKWAPADSLLIETDAPYLAPVPHRGKRNEPAFAAETARKLAELRGVPLEDLSAATTANFERLCLEQHA